MPAEANPSTDDRDASKTEETSSDDTRSPLDERRFAALRALLQTWIARGQAFAIKVYEFVQVMPGGTLLMRIITDIIRGNITDRAMTLAAQAFTGILPIVILMTTLPGSSYLDEALKSLGMHSEHVDFVSSSNDATVGTFGFIGALMCIAGATSLARALGRMYVSIWQVTKLPLSGWWRWVVVIFSIPVAVIFQGFATDLKTNTIFNIHIDDSGVLGIILVIAVTFIIWTITWTLIPRLLVSTQVPMRLLIVNGAVTGALVTAYLVGSRIALPRIVENTTQHYGTLGVVFIAISWLFFFGCILVVTALVVHAFVTDEGTIGRWTRKYVGAPKPMARTESARWYQPKI
ncbi:hypothetical protein [Gordonia sp. NPDC003585]|uniref:hypothetical protein n=1 Tax=Gordonia sp. NPDC003585 TaxID=3154275 RepID=UPI00339DC5BB